MKALSPQTSQTPLDGSAATRTFIRPASAAATQQQHSSPAAAQQLPSSSSSNINSFAVQLRAVQLRGVQCRYVQCSVATQTELSLGDFSHDDIIRFGPEPPRGLVRDASTDVEILGSADLWQDGGVAVYSSTADPLHRVPHGSYLTFSGEHFR